MRQNYFSVFITLLRITSAIILTPVLGHASLEEQSEKDAICSYSINLYVAPEDERDARRSLIRSKVCSLEEGTLNEVCEIQIALQNGNKGPADFLSVPANVHVAKRPLHRPSFTINKCEKRLSQTFSFKSGKVSREGLERTVQGLITADDQLALKKLESKVRQTFNFYDGSKAAANDEGDVRYDKNLDESYSGLGSLPYLSTLREKQINRR